MSDDVEAIANSLAAHFEGLAPETAREKPPSPVHWELLERALGVPSQELHRVFEVARRVRALFRGDQVSLYYPGNDFPSISVTGGECSLDCSHCGKKYLHGMIPAPTPDALYETCLELERKGARGCLVSGGCDEKGAVPLEPFLDCIARVKRETNLVLNLHTGLLSEAVADGLAQAGVDVVSFDVNVDPEVIRDVYHLDATPEDYARALKYLVDRGVTVVPHVCLGLNRGRLVSEFDALKFLSEFPFEVLVFIVLIPPRDPPAANLFSEPSPEDLARLVAVARLRYPPVDVALGCMRPKNPRARLQFEKGAVEAGASRLVMPSPKTRAWLVKKGYDLRVKKGCCAVHGEPEALLRAG
ncbi:MAG: radical SAM protein [Promethearchaeota archaeon]